MAAKQYSIGAELEEIERKGKSDGKKAEGQREKILNSLLTNLVMTGI